MPHRKQIKVSKERILQIEVQKLHPVLDFDSYQELCLKHSLMGKRRNLTLTFAKTNLVMVEDDVGVLCHCGVRFSRSSLETHLRPFFGPMRAAIKEKKLSDVENISFEECIFSGGCVSRVAESGQVPNTWYLDFTPKIKGYFKVNVNTRLVIAHSIDLVPGEKTKIYFEGKFVANTIAKEV